MSRSLHQGGRRARYSGFTEHAQVRMQQRGIAPDAVEVLLKYGREVHDHHGGVVCFLDKSARRRLERSAESDILRRFDQRIFNSYLVLAEDGSVVTVGHRHGRLWRH